MGAIIYDVTHTSHCLVNTGIQRVVRHLYARWPVRDELIPAVYDTYARKWRRPDAREQELVAYENSRKPGERRGASWSFAQRVRGRLARRGIPCIRELADGNDGLLTVELFGRERTPEVYAKVKRRKQSASVAVFYDMVVLQHPELSPRKTVEFYEEYLEKMLSFDIIAAISEYSRDVLLDYWKKRGVASLPDVRVLPLGVDLPSGDTRNARPSDSTSERTPLILCVGTLEGRKNHISLLAACETLWRQGLRFRLRLVGILNKETGMNAAREAERLQKEGMPLEWWSAASNDEVAASYAECDFTAYPSLHEGYGLPVVESLAHGRPCVCSGQNAMAELVRDGGCIAVGEPTAANLMDGIGALLRDSSLLAKLSFEARSRKIRSWSDYAADFRNLMLQSAQIP